MFLRVPVRKRSSINVTKTGDFGTTFDSHPNGAGKTGVFLSKHSSDTMPGGSLAWNSYPDILDSLQVPYILGGTVIALSVEPPFAELTNLQCVRAE